MLPAWISCHPPIDPLRAPDSQVKGLGFREKRHLGRLAPLVPLNSSNSPKLMGRGGGEWISTTILALSSTINSLNPNPLNLSKP